MKMSSKLLTMAALLLFAVTPTNSLSSDKKDVIVLSKDNTLVLNSEVNGESVGKVISAAKDLDLQLSSSLKEKLSRKHKPLYLFLNTPGGSVQSGLELIEAMKGLSRPVNTVTMFAASMGFQIAQGLNERLILKSGTLMSHRARGQFSGEFGGQAPSQIDSRYGFWKDRMDELDAETVSRSNGKQTLESYQQQYASEMWLTGTKSVAQGYADRVVSLRCDESLAGSTEQEFMFMGVVRITYSLDNCPINTSPTNVKVGFSTTRGYMDIDSFIKEGGTFGANCLMEAGTLGPSYSVESGPNKVKLCAMDTTLTPEKIVEIKASFVSEYLNKTNKIVPYRW